MPYEFKEEGGKVAAIDKKTGKVAFHSDSMEKAHAAARAREEHEHMGYSADDGEADPEADAGDDVDQEAASKEDLAGSFKAAFARRGYAEKYARDDDRTTPVAETSKKIPKVEANYRSAFSASRCEVCAHYRSGACELVEGPIKPSDVCDLFSPERADRTAEISEQYRKNLEHYSQPSDDISPEKAKEMLRDGTAHGHPLTEAQKGMLGAAVGRGEGK